MKKTVSAKVVVVWVLCMAAVMNMVEGKGSVTITNKLEQVVRVQCHSGDDYLSHHMLEPKMVYEFSFTPHLLGNTRFICDFAAEAYGKGHIKAWEGWLWTTRHITCSHCRWDVTATGFRCNGEYFYSWHPW